MTPILEAVSVRTPDGVRHSATLRLRDSTGHMWGDYRTACGLRGTGYATPVLRGTCPACARAEYLGGLVSEGEQFVMVVSR